MNDEHDAPVAHVMHTGNVARPQRDRAGHRPRPPFRASHGGGDARRRRVHVRAVRRCASGRRPRCCREQGVGPGDRVAFAASNSVEVLDFLAGTLMLGAVFVPLNTRLERVRAGVHHQRCRRDAPRRRPGDGGHDRSGRRLDHRAGGSASATRPTCPTGWRPVAELAASGDTSLGVPYLTDPDDVAVLMYTSGTTGNPKGVMISHGNVVAMLQSFLLLTPMGTDSGLLAMAPMFHVAALVARDGRPDHRRPRRDPRARST